MDNSKRSRADRETIKARTYELVQEMYDVKSIATKLNITVGYAYGLIKDMNYRKEFISAAEREQLRRQRYEQRNRGGAK